MWRAAIVTVSILATAAPSCASPCDAEPCGRIRGQVLLIGTVIGVEKIDPVLSLSGAHDQLATLKVQEVFSGLSNTRETVSVYSSSWMKLGDEFVVDAVEEDGRLWPTVCRNTESTSTASAREFVDVLRRWKQGKTLTTIEVRVEANNVPIEGAQVRLTATDGRVIPGYSDSEGIALFRDVPPAEYSVHVERENYRQVSDESEAGRERIEVAAGICNTARVAMESKASVSGILRDSDGGTLPGVALILSTDPFTGREVQTTAGAGGEFRFEGVLPGRYKLGISITRHSRTSIYPANYYPGVRSPDEAAEIVVSDGASVSGLEYQLPDFGPRRKIAFLVVDTHDVPQPGAIIEAGYGRSTGVGRLTTDENGRANMDGFAVSSYSLYAYLPAGAGGRRIVFSAITDIEPGEKPVTIRFTLRPLDDTKR